MAERLVMDSKSHELRLGQSFDPTSNVGFHSVRYDFKPASVDASKVSSVDINDKNEVTIQVPHVEGAGTTNTVYKGPKRPCQKECILIINHDTGEISLEKLTSTIQLKKTRKEGSSKAQQQLNRPVTPVDRTGSKKGKQSPDKRKKKNSPTDIEMQPSPALSYEPSPGPSPGPSPFAPSAHSPFDVGVMSSSDDGADSSDEESHTVPNKDVVKQSQNSAFHPPEKQGFMSTLKDDLQLSDSSDSSGSDSD
ncbi:unnamed protein product [Owenia fusiformis]|uniref:Uncharacterized protein n=1 Tax=Owenia fusiformis TaxID=6347 RepID=A0A8J1UX22_OWEFU|nr:unnamed protein product [Owenia fusiformis]